MFSLFSQFPLFLLARAAAKHSPSAASVRTHILSLSVLFIVDSPFTHACFADCQYGYQLLSANCPTGLTLAYTLYSSSDSSCSGASVGAYVCRFPCPCPASFRFAIADFAFAVPIFPRMHAPLTPRAVTSSFLALPAPRTDRPALTLAVPTA